MTQYNSLNVILFNSKLTKLESTIKNGTEVTFKILSNVGGSNDENNFPHKLLLTNTQVLRLRKDFAKIREIIKNYQKLNCIKLENQENF